MNFIETRISSILQSIALDSSITGFDTFEISELKLPEDLDFSYSTNVRLGHIAEQVFSGLVAASANYELLYENIQLKEGKQTIGELDFIIQNKETKEVSHVELAYKFYLYDPSISEVAIQNWIGPNRRDSLVEKLDKLRNKQFPLLKHSEVTALMSGVDVVSVSQKLCLLASLYIPYTSEEEYGVGYQEAIRGFYVNLSEFVSLHHQAKQYYIPHKKQWGIDPSFNRQWQQYEFIKDSLRENVESKQAVLVWQKDGEEFSEIMVVWW